MTASGLEAELIRPPEGAPFDPSELGALPDAARSYLAASIAPGTPVARTARLRMRGRLRLNGRWVPFRARETLTPDRGMLWTARVAGLVTGSDHALDGAGAMRWRLAGLATVTAADGPDVGRSAAGRTAGEAVWLPTSLLPRSGARWEADGDGLRVTRPFAGVDTTLRLRFGAGGLLESVTFERWGDPAGDGTWGLHPFGMDVARSQTFGGLTVPAEGVAGWHHGTPRWDEGMFFRFRLTSLAAVGPRRGASSLSGVDAPG